MSRFARQIALPEVGAAGQQRLAETHVLVVGAGGLGCPLLLYLACAGIGEITVMDTDRVERSNLHRQPLYTLGDIGARKVEAAGAALRQRAPELTLHLRPEALGAFNAVEAIAAADVVVDAADSFAVSYILSDACKAATKPLISASALGLSGYVGGYCGGGPCLRAVFPDLPEQAATCASAGVLGPLVGMIGAAQAQMVLQYVLGTAPSVLGQLMRFDMGALSPSAFRFDGAQAPEDGLRFVALTDPRALVVDLRDSAEAPEPVCPGARRVLPQDLVAASLPEGQPITLVCHSGLRAWRELPPRKRKMKTNSYHHNDLAKALTRA
ncbi:HesA/MoeB/ThiF family protein, partial [Phaeobacter sp. HF9A]|nr:HesA/MoeB/ThiF family protein [Phaeobacter sp. HF9A]